MKFLNKTFDREEIHLDGNEFVGCKINRCVIIYSGGKPPNMVNCDFIDCHFRFEMAAGNTIAFLRGLASCPGWSHEAVKSLILGRDDMRSGSNHGPLN